MAVEIKQNSKRSLTQYVGEVSSLSKTYQQLNEPWPKRVLATSSRNRLPNTPEKAAQLGRYVALPRPRPHSNDDELKRLQEEMKRRDEAAHRQGVVYDSETGAYVPRAAGEGAQMDTA